MTNTTVDRADSALTSGHSDDERLADRAVDLARELLAMSLEGATRSEKRRQERLGALLDDPSGREMIFALTDQVMRIDSPKRAAAKFADVVKRFPSASIGPFDRLMMRAGAIVAPRIPKLVMPIVVKRIKHETRGIVLPADDPAFGSHLSIRRGDGVRLNVNPLGEAILSDAEADERMASVLNRVERPDVTYVSVKVSAIVANLDALAFDYSVEQICDRLRTLYRRATAAAPTAFVNLDMEEYRDLELTLQSFMRVLGEPEFESIDAGIVLQAYLPDSHDALDRLGTWAAARRDAGGGQIKVRLVKGANLAMEHAEAEIHGWIAAPYATKADVDASYKAILDSALRPEWSDALRIGLASHNLFDIAWAFIVGKHRNALDRIDFEMLEGMAPSQARGVQALTGDLLMYAPVVAADDFDASIAYLTRRLDENTQPENFLRSLFTLVPDSPLFDEEVARFRTAVDSRHTVSRARRRSPKLVTSLRERCNQVGFENAAESDFADQTTRAAIADAMAAPPAPSFEVLETVQQIDEAVGVAVAAFERTDADPATRQRWLLDAAALMDAERFHTVGLLAHAVSKTAHEADPEIAEAIDFCRYYATDGRAAIDEARAEGFDADGRGVITVIGPWNFPYAIPTGGVAASIAAGNSVILKPAPEAIAVGAWIAEQFWRAGVPREVLQLVVCDDGPVGTHLVTHDDVDTVVLTGAHDTASMFLGWKPTMRLFAETSGKDALVITPSADLDQAIGDLVRSAFGHAGQKCSAASLGIVVGDLYDDPSFQQRLRDAVTSLRVGPATDPSSMMGPLIQAPTGALERALTTLDDGESWLVEPACLDCRDREGEARFHGNVHDNGEVDGEEDGSGRLWSPGVRLGVSEGSWFHRTECFGPVLGIMRADDLDHALRLQNSTSFGLTGGIHTLDDDEVDHWLANVEIGNAYINRHITGAIVQRQPFGGWKRSVVGGGAKAGGPGYVAQFSRISEPGQNGGPDQHAGRVQNIQTVGCSDRARRSFDAAWRNVFSVPNDPTALAVESNVLRYVPLGEVAVRHDGDRAASLALLRSAAKVVGVQLTESDSTIESDVEFAERIVQLDVDRVRLLGAMDPAARTLLHQADVAVDETPPVSNGRLELQHWVKEQAISRTMHRHGRLLR